MPISRITMHDVAREAGVSLMTVSRVINNKEDVSHTTRLRVLEVIDRLGYRPSSLARSLVTQQTGTLGLVVPDIDNPFFSGMVSGAEYEAYDQGYNVLLGNASEDPARELAVIRSFEDKGVDGLILCSSRLSDDNLRQVVERFPAVVLVSRTVDHARVGEVLIDDEAGGRQATEHLYARGHRKIAFLVGPPISQSGRFRVRGYQYVMRANGLEDFSDCIQSGASTIEGGYCMALNLLAENAAWPQAKPAGRRPTAVICHNDLVAVGVLQGCAELGLHVPDDLAVIGFDDIPLAGLVTPSLTTLHVERSEMGAQAMRVLLEHINAENSPNSHKPASMPAMLPDIAVENSSPLKVILKPELIIRASAP